MSLSSGLDRGSRSKEPEYYNIYFPLYMPCRIESELERGSSPREDKFKHSETQNLPNILHHNCFYRVCEDDDPLNVTYGSFDEDGTGDSSREFGTLNPDLLNLDLSVYGIAHFFYKKPFYKKLALEMPKFKKFLAISKITLVELRNRKNVSIQRAKS